MYIVCIVYSVGAKSNQKLNKIKMKTFELRSDDRTRNPHQRVGSWSSQPSRSWRGRWGELHHDLQLLSRDVWKWSLFSQNVMSVNKNGCLGKPRQTTMRGREKWRRCGRSLRSTTRSQGDLTEYLDVNLWICDRMFARQWTSEDSFDQQPCLQVSLWSLLSAQGNLQGALWLLRQGWASNPN